MSTRTPGETWSCEGCGAALIGARTKAGNTAPVTFNVQSSGNVLLFRSSVGIECRTFAGEILDALKAEQVPLRLNHFADCPSRDRFKGNDPHPAAA